MHVHANSLLHLQPLPSLPHPASFYQVLVWLKRDGLATCTLSGLESVYNALPLLGSGYRLNEVRLCGPSKRYWAVGTILGGLTVLCCTVLCCSG